MPRPKKKGKNKENPENSAKSKIKGRYTLSRAAGDPRNITSSDGETSMSSPVTSTPNISKNPFTEPLLSEQAKSSSSDHMQDNDFTNLNKLQATLFPTTIIKTPLNQPLTHPSPINSADEAITIPTSTTHYPTYTTHTNTVTMVNTTTTTNTVNTTTTRSTPTPVNIPFVSAYTNTDTQTTTANYTKPSTSTGTIPKTKNIEQIKKKQKIDKQDRNNMPTDEDNPDFIKEIKQKTKNSTQNKRKFTTQSSSSPNTSITIDSNPNKSTTSNRQNSQPVSRIPPVYAYSKDNSKLRHLITSTITPCPTFKFNNSALIIHALTSDTHNKLTTLLKTKDIEYHTYNLASLRPVKLCIKYIPADVSKEEIEDDLRLKHLSFLNVARIMIANGGVKRPSNILLITVPKDGVDPYYDLNELCQMKIKVTNYVRTDIPQCHRCQRFGHSSELCNRVKKCVRCGKTHDNNSCTAQKCSCANCGEEHPASYRGCLAYQTAKARYNFNNEQQQQTQKQSTKPTRPTTLNLNLNTLQQQYNFPPAPKSNQTNNIQPTTDEQVDEQITKSREAWQKFRTKDKNINTNPKTNQTNPNNPENQTQTNNEEDGNCLKEIISLVRSFNLKNIIKTIKDAVKKLKTTKDPMEKIFLIVEAVANLF